MGLNKFFRSVRRLWLSWKKTRISADKAKELMLHPDVAQKTLKQIRKELFWLCRNRKRGGMTVDGTIMQYFNMGIDRVGPDVHQYIFNYEMRKAREKRAISALGVLSDKWLTNLILKSGNVATISPILYKSVFVSYDEAIEAIKKSGHVEFFAKLTRGSKGKGSFVFTMKEDGFDIDGEHISDKRLIKKLQGYIVEPLIKQHEAMNAIYPYAVSSLRLVTMNKKGQIHIIQSALRVGAGENRTSNTYQGGVLLGVNDEGILSEYGVIVKNNRGKYYSHPDTGFVFKDFKVPYWKEATELAIKAHKCFPSFHTVGWDIAITKDGPLILEGNGNWSACDFQYTEGPGKARMEKFFLK